MQERRIEVASFLALLDDHLSSEDEHAVRPITSDMIDEIAELCCTLNYPDLRVA